MVQQTRQTQSTKPIRVPVGTRNVLRVVHQDPDYSYRFVNDTEDKIEIYKEGGWEVVQDKDKVGDPKVGESSQLSSAVTKAVGNGITAVLMRIRKEWYDADILAQLQRDRRLRDEIMQESRSRGLTNGTIKFE